MIYLVDISSFIFRAFYAVRPLTSPSGVPTNAVYGVFSMLLKFLKEQKPEYVAVCYDRPEPSFRKDIFTEYKANRATMPEDLIPQMEIIKNLISSMGLTAAEKLGFEADDLIGTLTKKAIQKNMKVVILSGDKDFSQILSDVVIMHDTMKNSKTAASDVFEKYGVRVDQFIDYQAIMGDSSDNIPGVSGIGPKGAQKLLAEFGTLENIYNNIEKVKPDSIRAKLEKDKEAAFLSKKLVTINQDVPTELTIESLKRKPIVWEEALRILTDLNFKTFEKALREVDLGSQGSLTLESAKPEINAQPVLDKSRDSTKHKIIDSSASQFPEELVKETKTWVFSSHQETLCLSQGEQIFRFQIQPELTGVLDSLKLSFEGFGVKEILRPLKLKDPKISWDSQIAAYVLRPGENQSFESICKKYLGAELELGDESSLLTSLVALKSQLLLSLQEAQQSHVYEELDLPLASLLYQMEMRGIKIDPNILKAQSNEVGAILQGIEEKAAQYSSEPINLNSPKQLQVLLFENLKLTPTKKTKTGFSTDSDVLEKLKNDHPIVPLLIEYRELAKLKSTYLDSLPLLMDEKQRLHSHFNQVLTTTGRLSSVDPNLQNIPIRTTRGAQIRKAFVAEDGLVLGSVDYSQIELRVLAHYSQDPQLCEAFKNDLDVHTSTASEVFSVPLNEVTGEQRRAAKAVNFGIAYGQGAFGLSEALGIPRGEASEIIQKYFTKFPGVRDYIESTILMAKEKGFVETLFGRRRYIDELKSSNNNILKFGERAAINAPIQGTAADLMKKGMIDVAHRVSLPMILQIHDELIFEAKKEDLLEAEPVIRKTLESVIELKVPLKVNFSIGKNWGEAHD